MNLKRDYLYVDGHYTLLASSRTCQEAGKEDMPIYGEWVGLARASVGLSYGQAVALSGLPFALVCMHRPLNTEVIVTSSCAEDAANSPDYQCIRNGVLTTTATSTIG